MDKLIALEGTDLVRRYRDMGDGTFAEVVTLAGGAVAVDTELPPAVEHDAIDAGAPLKVGLYAGNTAPAAVADGDRVNAWGGRNGQQAAMIVSSVGTVAGLAVANQDGTTPNSAGVIAMAQMLGFNGAALERIRVANIVKPLNAVGAGAEIAVWTPAASKKFRLMQGIIASSIAGDVVFRDAVAGAIILVVPVLAGAPTPFDLRNGILSGAANNVLTADAPGAGVISGFIAGTEE